MCCDFSNCKLTLKTKGWILGIRVDCTGRTQTPHVQDHHRRIALGSHASGVSKQALQSVSISPAASTPDGGLSNSRAAAAMPCCPAGTSRPAVEINYLKPKFRNFAACTMWWSNHKGVRCGGVLLSEQNPLLLYHSIMYGLLGSSNTNAHFGDIFFGPNGQSVSSTLL